MIAPILVSFALIASGPFGSASLLVTDQSGRPVEGAMLSDSSRITISDENGCFDPAPEAGDMIFVRALGYADWSGPTPGDGSIVLRAVPLPSGVVIPVTAGRMTASSVGLSVTEAAEDLLPSIGMPGAHSLEVSSPGAVVREYGGAVSILSLSIRGSDPAQIGWMIDGRRIGSSTDGTSGICLMKGLFSSFRLARGGGSAFAGGGLAGTVELFTPEADSPPSVFAGADSRGGLWVGGSVSLDRSFRVSCSLAEPVGPQGGEGRAGGMSALYGRGGFSSGLLVTSAEGDAESPDWSPVSASLSRSSIDSWFSLDLPGGFSANAGGHLGGTGYTASSPDHSRDRNSERSADLGMSLRISPSPSTTLEAYCDARGEWASGTSLGSRRRSLASLGGAVARDSDPFMLSGAVRAEAEDGGGMMAGARLGAGFRAARGIALEASLSRSFRRPTFNELYWPSDPFAEGNPGLDPETSLEFDLAARFERGVVSAGIAFFRADSDDLIAWAPSGDGVWRPGNISRVERRGIEIDARCSSGIFDAGFAATFSRTEDRTPGSTNEGMMLPYRPGATLGLDAGIDLGALDAGATLVFTGRRYINSANTVALPAYCLFGGTLGFHLPQMKGLELELSGVNLLDTVYEETNGYPGRRATISFGMEWKGAR